MTQTLIAIISLLIGVGLNEWLRRTNRIEAYSHSVFQKRLSIYEQLWERIQAAYAVAGEVMSNDKLSKEERHRLVSTVVLDIAEFCDANRLYLNDEVTIHCCTMCMGAEDVLDLPKGKKRDSAESQVRDKYKEALTIIKDESGIRQFDQLFRRITKPHYSSDVIDYFREIQDEKNGRVRSKHKSVGR